jgi:hypothetical protein
MAHSVSRSTLLAGLLTVAIVTLGAPAFAKKKKAAAPADETPTSEVSNSSDKKPAEPKAQAGDTERPSPIIDPNDTAAEGPKADAEGNVNFAGARVGKGKITVRAAAKEKVKVYLEGRYFGMAPRTITKIPPGDYVVEVVFPNGKSVTKPVSVSGDEESIVQLGAADAAPTVAAEKPMAPELAERRWDMAKMIGIGAGVAVLVGLSLGIWEHSVQGDYNNKLKMPPANQAPAAEQTAYVNALKSLSDKGDHLALGANICYVAGALGLITAVVIGYPAYKARKAERKPASPETNVSFLFAPGPTLGSGSAGLLLQF